MIIISCVIKYFSGKSETKDKLYIRLWDLFQKKQDLMVKKIGFGLRGQFQARTRRKGNYEMRFEE